MAAARGKNLWDLFFKLSKDLKAVTMAQRRQGFSNNEKTSVL